MSFLLDPLKRLAIRWVLLPEDDRLFILTCGGGILIALGLILGLGWGYIR